MTCLALHNHRSLKEFISNILKQVPTLSKPILSTAQRISMADYDMQSLAYE